MLAKGTQPLNEYSMFGGLLSNMVEESQQFGTEGPAETTQPISLDSVL